MLCLRWVDTPQVAKLYSVWILLKNPTNRKLPKVVMLQNNLQAMWAGKLEMEIAILGA